MKANQNGIKYIQISIYNDWKLPAVAQAEVEEECVGANAASGGHAAGKSPCLGNPAVEAGW